MLRSLYTGISGLRSHQTMMDVTGNNIANVNTTGYKTANTVFADTLSQTLAAATAPGNVQGGTNPAQVGLGVRVAGITTNFSQGATQVTGRNTDMLISGDGFFVVSNNNVNQYTRAGALSLDARGALVSLAGGKIQGWQADANGAVDTSGATTELTIPIGQLLDPEATTTVTFGGALDSTAALYVDPTNIGGAFTRSYGIYDKTGISNEVSVEFRPTALTGGLVNEWELIVTHPGLNDGATPPVPTSVAATLSIDYSTTPPTKSISAGAGSGSSPLRIPVTGILGKDGVVPFDIEIDIDALKVQDFTGDATSTAAVKTRDGAAASTLTSWQVAPDGTIGGSFSDGRTQSLGRIAIASFDNPAGLSKEGGSVYAASTNSGVAQIGSAGDAGRGTIVAGALEMSNVDLAQEFTNLIVSQRGFQANSRVITSSDEMLQELVNLKR